MRRPEFSDEEQFLISWYKSAESKGIGGVLADSLTYIVPTLVVVALGLYYHSMAALVAGYTVLLLFKVREAVVQPRYQRLTRSILNKYEAALHPANHNRDESNVATVAASRETAGTPNGAAAAAPAHLR